MPWEARVAQRVINDVLTNDGRGRRAFLGLEFSQTYQDYSYGEGMWMPSDSLPVISGIIPGSPASAYAETLKEATVYAINGAKIMGIEQVQEEMGESSAR